MKNEITSKEYWEQSGVLNAEEHPVPVSMKKLFKKVLVKSNNESVALEIGCAPGDFLAYLCNEFNYRPEGIDYVEDAVEITKNTLIKNGLSDSTIYKEDFFTWNPKKKYDLVCSFGFIEHFNDVRVVIDKHVSLLKDNGKLIIEVPNFANGQYLLHKFLDKENFERHNTESMNLKFFKKTAKDYNLKIKHLGYVGGIFDFWWENNNPNFLQKIFRFILKILAFIGRRIPINNRFFSPFLVFIAEKKV